uniref:Dihydroorotase n=1 Tax=uncultured Thiotrichaceae bacterium TaxID=298394 RepID=A0A6S6SIC7_9GAMM|nr:MAG: Dihydroorotase [uncultured Thiotrichaceae bacterium]
MERLLVCNAQIVNEGSITAGDVLIEQGRISAIGTVSASGLDDSQIIDAAGRFLLPGMIDNYVHFREPGMTMIADMASESAASVAGWGCVVVGSTELMSGVRDMGGVGRN